METLTGRPLDARVATAVLGWQRFPYILTGSVPDADGIPESWGRHTVTVHYCPPEQRVHISTVRPVPAFSADMTAAWTVHLAMCQRPFSVRQRYLKALQRQTRRAEDGLLVAWPDVLVVLADRMPESICLAALEALEDAG